MFKVGDKVVYPMHGAGVIEALETRTVFGEVRQYYVLKMPIGDMKLMIPVGNAESIGLRQVISPEIVQQVLEEMGIERELTTTNWNRRYRSNSEKIKSGDIFMVADVVCNLVQRDRDKGLSTCERKMLDNARQILSSEMALAKGIDQEGALKLLARAVE
jgi:CarD family transcriptional regulator